jgi:hypothetical protein
MKIVYAVMVTELLLMEGERVIGAVLPSTHADAIHDQVEASVAKSDGTMYFTIATLLTVFSFISFGVAVCAFRNRMAAGDGEEEEGEKRSVTMEGMSSFESVSSGISGALCRMSRNQMQTPPKVHLAPTRRELSHPRPATKKLLQNMPVIAMNRSGATKVSDLYAHDNITSWLGAISEHASVVSALPAQRSASLAHLHYERKATSPAPQLAAKGLTGPLSLTRSSSLALATSPVLTNPFLTH